MERKKTINKLFLVGNGFDRALGLKTTYEDFLFWYFSNFIIKSFQSKKRKLDENRGIIYWHNEDELFHSFNTLEFRYNQVYIQTIKNEYNTYDKLKKFIKDSPVDFIHQFKSELLETIFNESINGWVDIEGAYFKLLKKEFYSKSKKNLDKLNSNLVYITKLLKQYLSEVDISKTTEKQLGIQYINQFISPITSKDVIYQVSPKSVAPKTYYFLNFNYTNTLSNIIEHLETEHYNKYDTKIKKIISPIHGALNNEEIIFGYGDEMDKDYVNIQDLNDNRFFENIKSFKYNKSPEYRNLLRFLNSDYYQVIIYGHSCGLSDRLLLNEVFEHDNCKSIKIYYYNEAEFTTKTMDISRHFKSNQLMRQKIIDFNENCRIPQIEE